MATTINVHDAKTHLSSLLQRVEAGEEIVIARAGEPVAKLIPVPRQKPRVPGLAKGMLTVPDSFFDPLPEDLLRAFEGRADPENDPPPPKKRPRKK